MREVGKRKGRLISFNHMQIILNKFFVIFFSESNDIKHENKDGMGRQSRSSIGLIKEFR